jgi:hypothetical protein
MSRLRLAAALVVAALGSLVVGGWVSAWYPPAPDLQHLPVDPEALARIDLRLVHEELVPDWVVARGGMKGLHFDRLRREAGQDPALRVLLDRMEVLFSSDPVANAPELLALIRAWNEVLSRGNQPWRLAGEVRIGQDGGELLLKTYRVVYDGGQVRVGDRSFRAEVRRRVDKTSLVDGWLGHMHDHEDGVVVLLDRVTNFALDQVWPMLDDQLDPELDPLSRAFAPAIRRELAAALAENQLAALVETGADRYWMVRAAEAITQRRQCGSAFFVARIPWNGMAPRDIAVLQQHVAPGDPGCPEVTEPESLVFAVRSAHTRAFPDVRDALEALVGVVAHAVVVHEARHAYDDEVLAGQRIPCLGCPPDTSHVSALEGAAYLASFADAHTGALSMYQACALDPVQVPDRASMIAYLSERLTPNGCADGPPADLAAASARLATEVFGGTVPIDVVDFPASLPVGEEW